MYPVRPDTKRMFCNNKSGCLKKYCYAEALILFVNNLLCYYSGFGSRFAPTHAYQDFCFFFAVISKSFK